MIDAKALLGDLKLEVTRLEDDIRDHVEEHQEIRGRLRSEHTAAQDASRTAAAYESWRDDRITQAAVAWTLACVFVRFMEDNALVDDPLLSGPEARLRIARDHHALFFQNHPEQSDREYLEHVFERAASLPGGGGLFDRRHNPLWAVPVSADGATELIEFWRRRDDATGELRHDFSDLNLDTRFLGDLYQNLSEAARKQYALLQTPEFVESFILDHTLDPAVEEFGLDAVHLIDPACGSGHFLLGAFARLLARWREREPATNPTVLAQRALDAIAGVDLNPFAVAIARFRLLVAAMTATKTSRFLDAPAFTFRLAAGDSLLHGPRPGQLPGLERERAPRFEHAYATEDLETLENILAEKYQVVVGNPPYITAADPAVRELVRDRYGSCRGKYSLAVPFTERFFDLASSSSEDGQPASGYLGFITAKSFMTRSFGKRLVEKYIPGWDVTHLIDTTNVALPGYGTPTVIIFGRHRTPVLPTIRTVMGIRKDVRSNAYGAGDGVWRAILDQLNHAGSESRYVSVADVGRDRFTKHPWSLGGGGAAELKEALEGRRTDRLGDRVTSVGFYGVPGAGEAFVTSMHVIERESLELEAFPRMASGRDIRDWGIKGHPPRVFFPYHNGRLLSPNRDLRRSAQWLWPYRSRLWARATFTKKTYREEGREWWEWHQLSPERVQAERLLVFGEVASHNQFALSPAGFVFDQTAPVAKLGGTSNDDHLGMLGLLNSSTGTFWLKQIAVPRGVQHDAPWTDRYAFDSTKVSTFPLTEKSPVDRARALDALSDDLADASPEAVFLRAEPSGEAIEAARIESDFIRGEMIAEQEELDWECYRHYGVLEDPPLAVVGERPPVRLGQRAFEIVLARQVAAGQEEPTWFERHGSTPLSEIPEAWPDSYREVVRRRIELIESSREISLIERPDYKRRWSLEPWDKRLEVSLRSWLLARLETRAYWPRPELRTVAQLSDAARADGTFMRVAALLKGSEDFDASALVAELVASEAVPFLPILRYNTAGLRKRAQWEQTWKLQRLEDEIDALTELPENHPEHLEPDAAERRKRAQVGTIAVPPDYTTADMRPGVWSLRGKLDVPRERFTSFPGVRREADPTLLVGWAGWNHLERAKAIVSYMSEREQLEGWGGDRLVPLLAGLHDLLPWLKQWHNDLDPEFGQRMGDVYEGHLGEQLARHGLTADDLERWTPPESRRGRRRTKEAPV